MTIATFSDHTATFPQTAATNAAGTAIIEARHVGKTYRAKRGKELTVLRDISFTLHEGEIVAILGRSGAGKSTFLRILAGLVPASSGTVTYRGTDITGPNPGVGLVFQTFALMPWLTVQANVELGLEARGVPREERRRAALQASTPSDWTDSRTRTRRSSPAACASAWASHGPWWCSPMRCSWTSRSPHWMC